jgi:hypothetical protein
MDAFSIESHGVALNPSEPNRLGYIVMACLGLLLGLLSCFSNRY